MPRGGGAARRQALRRRAVQAEGRGRAGRACLRRLGRRPPRPWRCGPVVNGAPAAALGAPLHLGFVRPDGDDDGIAVESRPLDHRLLQAQRET